MRVWLLAAWLGSLGVAAADQVVVHVPAAVGEELGRHARWGRVVDVERSASGVVVTVTQTLRPLTTGPIWPLPDPAACGDPAALEVDPRVAGTLAALLPTRQGQSAISLVAEVVRFVSQRVVPDEHDSGPQDAVSVLTRRRGRCSGRANAAVGLLRTLGLPARVVHGVLLTDGGPQRHRWGEVWLGEAGWVPFDPGASVGVVSVRYLPLEGAETVVPSIRLESVNEEGFSSLPLRGGLRLLPTVGITLRCQTAPPQGERVLAVLTGPDGSRWARLGVGAVAFPDLIPGWYRLSWVLGGGESQTAVLRLGEVRDVQVALAGKGG